MSPNMDTSAMLTAKMTSTRYLPVFPPGQPFQEIFVLYIIKDLKLTLSLRVTYHFTAQWLIQLKS